MKYFLIICIFAFAFCSRQANTETIDPASTRCRQDTIGGCVFNIKDTTSNLYISYHECTECIDAWIDSGKLFIPEYVHQKIKERHKNRPLSFFASDRDLYLTGPDKINETLFGDSLNYGEHWGHKFLVTGKAIDIKNHGVVFRVDSYIKIN